MSQETIQFGISCFALGFALAGFLVVMLRTWHD